MISLILLALVFLFGVLPVTTPAAHLPTDKIFHALAFFWIGFYAYTPSTSLPRRALFIGGLTVAGLALEVFQAFLPHRSFEWADAGMDALGLWMGFFWPGHLRDTLERMVLHLGVGRIPLAPATWGSLLAVLGFAAYPLPYPAMGGALAFGLVIGWQAYRRHRDQEDPPWVVLDEALAVWMFLPLLPSTWAAWLTFFLMFRVMDIAKPLGIRLLERPPGGIFWDDIGAAALAFLLTRGLLCPG